MKRQTTAVQLLALTALITVIPHDSAIGGRSLAPQAQIAASGAMSVPVRLSVKSVTRHRRVGRAVLVRGRAHGLRSHQAITLERRGNDGRWRAVGHTRSERDGGFRLSWRPERPGRSRLRLTAAGKVKRIGPVVVYRSALASWYGPGLFGGPLACGGRLKRSTVGVAHKTLPCGTRLTVRLHGRSIRVPVIDRGPYVGGREFDLTAAVRNHLGFDGVGTVLVSR